MRGKALKQVSQALTCNRAYAIRTKFVLSMLVKKLDKYASKGCAAHKVYDVCSSSEVGTGTTAIAI